MLEFRPPLIGREAELSSLLQHLERAKSGHGGTVFVSGEAGIGKTRLLEELKAISRSRGVQVLAASSLYESLTPFMPFLEALRSGGLEYLLVEHTPRIEGMYLLTDTGLLVKSVVRPESTSLDSDIFAGMLTTVNNFVADSLSRLHGETNGDSMHRLDYGDYSIMLEWRERTILVAIVTGKETEFLVDDMRDSLAEAERRCEGRLKTWEGDEMDTSSLEDLLLPLLDKYDGTSYVDQSPKAKRDLMFENVALGLVRRAHSAPILLCLEDLQWADPSTLALLHHVARSAQGTGLLIVGTYRVEDLGGEGADRSLIDTMIRMDREDLLEKIRLERMSEETTAEVVTSLLGSGESIREIARIIQREGEGNPLFSIEMIKLMTEEGILLEERGSWKLNRPVNEWEIPVRIRDAILRRLDHVADEHREVLDCASVIGEEFSSEVLASALPMDRQHLLRTLRTLETRHSMIHPQDGRYRFHHVKIKDVLYSELPSELRGELHETIAKVIEHFGEANPDLVAGDLAFHYSRGKDRGKALLYLQKAADSAKARYANEEAIRFYREALEFQPGSEKALEILESLGSLQDRMGYFQDCIGSYKAALDLDLASRKNVRGRILTKLGAAFAESGNLKESDRICKEALDMLRGEGSPAEALALQSLGFSHRSRGEFDLAMECFEQSIAVLERLGDRSGIARSLYHIGVLYDNRGDFNRAADYYGRSLELAEKVGPESSLMMALVAVGTIHGQLGEFDDALRYFGRSLALAEKVGDREWTTECLGNMGNLHLNRGEYDKAFEYLDKCIQIDEKTGNEAGLACVLPFRGLIRAERGDVDGAVADCERSLRLLEGTESPYETGVCLLMLGRVHLIRDDGTQAVSRLKAAEEVSRTIGALELLVWSSSLLAELHLKQGDFENAHAFAQGCSAAAGASANQNLKAEAECALGMIHRDEGNFEESFKNFEISIAIRRKLGFVADLRRPYYELGLSWRSHGDMQKARENLEIALRLSEELGTPWAAERARRALHEIPT